MFFGELLVLSPTATFCTLAVGFSALPAKAKVEKRLKLFSQSSELFTLNVDHLLTTIKAVRADVVTEVNFTGLRFNSRSRVRQEVMSTVIAALVGRFFILLDCHSNTPL